MKFFDINGIEIDKKQFISLYNDSYYIDYVDYTDHKGNKRKIRKKNYVPGLNQSSRFVEAKIDKLLKEGIKSKLDVVHILAWKVGRIAHLGSESKFAYTDDWANAEEFEVTLRKNKFDIKKMVDYIVSNIKALEEKAANDPQGVLCDLESVRAVGFGPVYLITLLYFISRGKYPIYDRFAMMAVDAIIAGTKPGNTVVYCELPSKDSKEFNTIMQDHMIELQPCNLRNTCCFLCGSLHYDAIFIEVYILS